ncbi:MAG: hypothetical protein DI551_09195 [Micavibrio aeruginosavorus]|uniref:Uncharacterized protein n=1 Tax=Micavibrio aeruginosavorus TaxID=349221 RepID=A0A2W5MUP0_9BACT|nr:MAG: hypothetical protein DI551_09195 [Micavibrio aeruginosavorus]
MIWGAVLTFALLGGWLSRMCGGGPPKLPWGLDQWIYALPYMLISIPATASMIIILYNADKASKGKYAFVIKPPAMIAVAPFVGAFLGKRTGHGGGMDLGTNAKEPGHGREPEALEFFILSIHGKIPQYWYDALLLAITGFAVTLLTGVVICFVDVPAGLLIAFSGLLKAPAYMIGRKIYPEGNGKGIPYLNEATAIGEYLTGFFGWGALALALVMITGT